MLRYYVLQEDLEQKKFLKVVKKKVCEMIVEFIQRFLENEGRKCSGMDDIISIGNIVFSIFISDGFKFFNGVYLDMKSELSLFSVNVVKNDSQLVVGLQVEFKDGEKSVKSKKEIRLDSGKFKQNF